jgi:ribosome-binding factor A
MPVRKPSRKRLRYLCAEVHPDDGSDPRAFFRKAGSRGRSHHKARQLCRQVAESLDAMLGELTIVSIDPAPDAATLLVTIAARPSSDTVDPAQILGWLDRVSGRLRSEVASAITRRRVPMLIYRVFEVRSGIDPADHRD